MITTKLGGLLLVNTEIMTEEGVAAGGLLLFEQLTSNRFLSHAGIDAAAYLGTEKDYAARERNSLRGPMTPLLAARRCNGGKWPC